MKAESTSASVEWAARLWLIRPTSHEKSRAYTILAIASREYCACTTRSGTEYDSCPTPALPVTSERVVTTFSRSSAGTPSSAAAVAAAATCASPARREPSPSSFSAKPTAPRCSSAPRISKACPVASSSSPHAASAPHRSLKCAASSLASPARGASSSVMRYEKADVSCSESCCRSSRLAPAVSSQKTW